MSDTAGVPVPETGAAHLLLVEDDATSARVLSSILAQAGYRVSLATDGTTALERLDSDLPDLVLLDWMIPGISGLEVCHRARQRWDPLVLPILMVTAKTDPESVYAAFDAGANDYVLKPFRGAEIRARIAAHLRTKRLVEDRTRIEEHLREREKLASLGLLASGVAHDLNNPLAVISGHAQMMLRATPPGAEEQVPLRAILDGVARCQRIVGELLGFARPRPTRRQPTDLGALLHATLGLREREIRNAGLTTELIVADGLAPIVADDHQLQQVFLNILLNAEQALRGGGSTLVIRASADAVIRDAAPGVRVEFINDGPAIAPEVLPRIFDPFFTTKPTDEGTGLGLAIARRIVREHGGQIEVESDPRQTVFRVLLPATAE